MSAKTLMILGSMSSVGKSLITTGLCRLYARRGWRTAPFKAQNISNNAAVCSGGEIGRAQAVQAYAAGIEPSVDMNPILLKSEGDHRSQMIVRGQVLDSNTPREFYTRKDYLWQVVTDSLDTLKDEYDLVILEGAGSPAEVNLRKSDMVNLETALYAQAPCLLVGDIERGGIFAQLLGTFWLLEEKDQSMIRAMVVNKFRGDMDLFKDGVQILEQRSGLPILGVVPYLHAHSIPQEDSTGLDEQMPVNSSGLDIAVIHLPHVSNFDDLDPLKFEPGVQLSYVRQVKNLGKPAAVILPGTKNTLEDLHWLHQTGLSQAVQKLASTGTHIVGLCGGYQMLGETVSDAHSVESQRNSLPGLGLLPVQTNFENAKTVTRSQARITTRNGFFKQITGEQVHGYEIHMGLSTTTSPICQIEFRETRMADVPDGACSDDGRIWGTYLHGIFDNDNFRRAWLDSMGVSLPNEYTPYTTLRTRAYDHLADVLEASLDIHRLDQIIASGI